MKGGDPRYPYRISVTPEQAERLGRSWGAPQRAPRPGWGATERTHAILQVAIAACSVAGATGLLPLSTGPLVIGALVIMVLSWVRV